MTLDFHKGMAHFSATFAPQTGVPHTFDQSIERISALQTDIGHAGDDHLFVPLPTEIQEKPKDWSRIKTIRNRLFCLGYIEKDTGTGHLDDTIKNGIKAFQSEAGLQVDGWIGEKETWPALQELVSFETPIDLKKWFNPSGPKPVLCRAIGLRLFVLGLNEAKPKSANEDIRTGIKKFGQIWDKLKFAKPTLPVGINPEWVERLFDMDTITKNLSKVSTPLNRKLIQESHSLIINAAKIELWLKGYHVKPNGYDLKQTNKTLDTSGLTKMDIWKWSKTLSQKNTVKKSIRFYRGLHSFWVEQGKDDDTADELSVNFLKKFQLFFKIMDEEVSRENEFDANEAQEKIEAFVNEKHDQLPNIWDNVKRFGARIWDGIRRAWGWFKRMVSSTVKKIKKIGLNMSRIIYNFTLGSFTVLSNIMKSIGRTIQFIVDPVMPGSDLKHVLFIKDGDFDPRAIINETAQGDEVNNCCRVLEYEVRKFSFGCRVIGTFVVILMEVLTKGWAGYFSLVFALVKLRQLRFRLKSLMDEYTDIFVIQPI